ncbi:MAG: hypothetical protein ACKVP5_18825 [Aestuariivirga sp.]
MTLGKFDFNLKGAADGAIAMQGQKYWIERGQLVPEPKFAPEDLNESHRIHRSGGVRVLTGPVGTEVRWALFAPNLASLYFAMEWLQSVRGPYVLRYFLSGWFEEIFSSTREATARLNSIIAKCDLHLTSRTYVKQLNLDTELMPPLLRSTLADNGIAEQEYSIDCVFEESIGRYRVARIGAKSAIARFYAHTPVPFPCINGGSYDDTVSAAYTSVLQAGRPRYDHIYSAMSAPDGSVIWIPYQRVILPRRDPDGKPSVTVTSEIAKVDIQIV